MRRLAGESSPRRCPARTVADGCSGSRLCPLELTPSYRPCSTVVKPRRPRRRHGAGHQPPAHHPKHALSPQRRLCQHARPGALRVLTAEGIWCVRHGSQSKSTPPKWRWRCEKPRPAANSRGLRPRMPVSLGLSGCFRVRKGQLPTCSGFSRRSHRTEMRNSNGRGTSSVAPGAPTCACHVACISPAGRRALR